MRTDRIVAGSDLTDSFLPRHIQESYSTFVDFMTTATEAQERVGSASFILQDLLTIRDFDTFRNNLIEFNFLNESLSEEDDEMHLVSGVGFPETDGVVLIDNEIIYYRERRDNTLIGLQRGASGTSVLPKFNRAGKFQETEVAFHNKETKAFNLSILFLVSMLETIHKSFTADISREHISPDVNRSTILQNIKDFFQSKGTKLGVQTLFRMIFKEDDVDVFYPGDRMIKASTSTWSQSKIMRVSPLPEEVLGDVEFDYYVQPDAITSEHIYLKSYNDNKIYAQAMSDFEKSYGYGDKVEYELRVNTEGVIGNFITNPSTTLTRDVFRTNTAPLDIDVTTITVESTLGFPESGHIFIDSEMIEYENKSSNQFLNCKRGKRGADANHFAGDRVFGPYFIEMMAEKEGEVYLSRSFPLGLVDDVIVREPGLLHEKSDIVYIKEAGEIDQSEVALSVFIENLNSDLAETTTISTRFIGNVTHGIDAVYFDDRNIFVSSGNLPDYPIGPFSNDGSLGGDISTIREMHVIPQSKEITDNIDIYSKGTDMIGVFANGVPAFSNESEDKVYHGDIIRFNVINQGQGYKTPYIMIEPNNSTAEARVVDGRIVDVIKLSIGKYEAIPEVRVVAGEGCKIKPILDPYGRIVNVDIIDNGLWYRDEPILTIVDSSGRGKGGLLKPIMDTSSASVIGVEIINSGIDYDSTYTTIEVKPQGSGAVITADVEYFTPDRVYQTINSRHENFDLGNGTLIANGLDGKRDRYGYIHSPRILRAQLGDNDRFTHSPILGYALDGCPIYGPYGYVNGIDDSKGVGLVMSPYVLADDRSLITPGGYREGERPTNPNPPSTFEYPMGYFCEDYILMKSNLNPPLILTEKEENINTELIEELLSDAANIIDPRFKNENGGRVCNTPDFPADLYPDGVYCYFLSTDELNNPVFPYIIGKTFEKHPISQNVHINDLDNEEFYKHPQNTPLMTLENQEIYFDLFKTDRHQNGQLKATKDEVFVSIGSLTTGDIHDVYVKEGGNKFHRNGDFLRFDNTDTQGSGASAIVKFVKGEQISDSYGSIINAIHNTHIITYDLSSYSFRSFVFHKGMQVNFISGARGIVISYLQEKNIMGSKILSLEITTPELPSDDDCFFDGKGQIICLSGFIPYNSELTLDEITIVTEHSGETVEGTEIEDSQETILVANPSVIVSSKEPQSMPDAMSITDGDIWWSDKTGKMYVSLNDEWIVTQPLGMRPFSSASNEEMIGFDGPTVDFVHHPGSVNTVTISEKAPVNRFDGRPNSLGDLWWSPHTGVLYIFYSYYLVNGTVSAQGYDDGEVDTTNSLTEGVWVPTDPSGMKNYGDESLDYIFPDPVNIREQDAQEPSTRSIQGRVKIYIGDAQPTGIISQGALWYCTRNGKTFIRYNVDWVITNPHGWLSSVHSLDDLVDGDGGWIPPALPDDQVRLRTNELLYFDDITNFNKGNDVIFENGITGTVIEKIYNAPGKTINIDGTTRSVLRPGDDALIISKDEGVVPDKMLMTNMSRCVFTIETVEPHRLKKGDTVRLSNAAQEGLNGVYKVVNGFQKEVNDGYSSKKFTIYTDALYAFDPSFEYDTDGDYVTSSITEVDIISKGVGYQSLPVIAGVRKRDLDEVETMVQLSGTAIERVDILKPGSRYNQPFAEIIDLAGYGRGATVVAFVQDERIANIQVVERGKGYREPICIVYDTDPTLYPITDNIGGVVSMEVINPGRDISHDINRRPEVKLEAQVMVDAAVPLNPGSIVHQGNSHYKYVEGVVMFYDDSRGLLSVNVTFGDIDERFPLRDENGNEHKIITAKESQLRMQNGALSQDRGSFVNDEGKIYSEENDGYARIQDSYYYQHFSYVISSPLQQSEFKDFTDNLTHPSGFKMFSEVLIDKVITRDVQVDDMIVNK